MVEFSVHGNTEVARERITLAALMGLITLRVGLPLFSLALCATFLVIFINPQHCEALRLHERKNNVLTIFILSIFYVLYLIYMFLKKLNLTKRCRYPGTLFSYYFHKSLQKLLYNLNNCI